MQIFKFSFFFKYQPLFRCAWFGNIIETRVRINFDHVTILLWIRNHLHNSIWNITTNPCHNYNGAIVKPSLMLGHGWLILVKGPCHIYHWKSYFYSKTLLEHNICSTSYIFPIPLPMSNTLTPSSRVTHTCVVILTIIGSYNSLSSGRRQASISSNAGILLYAPLGTNLAEIWIPISTISSKKMHLKCRLYFFVKASSMC